MIFYVFESTHFKCLCYVYNSRAVVKKQYAQTIYEKQTDKKTNRNSPQFHGSEKKMERKTTQDDFQGKKSTLFAINDHKIPYSEPFRKQIITSRRKYRRIQENIGDFPKIQEKSRRPLKYIVRSLMTIRVHCMLNLENIHFLNDFQMLSSKNNVVIFLFLRFLSQNYDGR